MPALVLQALSASPIRNSVFLPVTIAQMRRVLTARSSREYVSRVGSPDLQSGQFTPKERDAESGRDFFEAWHARIVPYVPA